MGYPDHRPLIGGRTDIALGYSAKHRLSSRQKVPSASPVYSSFSQIFQGIFWALQILSGAFTGHAGRAWPECNLPVGPLMRFVPVFAYAGVDFECYRQRSGLRHQLGYCLPGALDIVLGDFEYQLIVYLHDHFHTIAIVD